MIKLGLTVIILSGFYEGCVGKVRYHRPPESIIFWTFPAVTYIIGNCKGIQFQEWFEEGEFKKK